MFGILSARLHWAVAVFTVRLGDGWATGAAWAVRMLDGLPMVTPWPVPAVLASHDVTARAGYGLGPRRW